MSTISDTLHSVTDTASRTDYARRIFTPSKAESVVVAAGLQLVHRSRLDDRAALIGEVYRIDSSSGHMRYLLVARLGNDVFVNDSLRLLIVDPEHGTASTHPPAVSPYQYEKFGLGGISTGADGSVLIEYCDWSERTPRPSAIRFSDAIGWQQADSEQTSRVSCSSNVSAFAFDQTHDGRWWRLLSPHARYEFVVGILECFNADAGGQSRGPGRSFDELRNRVTATYLEHSERVGSPVLDVLLGLDSIFILPGQATSGRRRQWRERFADGLYWFNMASEPTSEVAYVAGYLECLRRFAPDQAAAFPMSPGAYATQISQWYWEGGEEGDMNGERQPQAVVDVLRRVSRAPH